jgi:hypothetical protein
MIYQSYLQTAGPTEKYMFDKSNFKIQSVRNDKFEILPIVQEFFKQPTGQRDVANAGQVIKRMNCFELRMDRYSKQIDHYFYLLP